MTTLEDVSSLDTAHSAAHDGALVVDRSRLGMLKFTGKSRLDLLNRMSTQKVDMLASGQGAATVLTTDIGRIIDRLILYASSDSVYCLTGENNDENVSSYLKRFVFFMDDFHVENLTEQTAILAVYGRGAGEVLSSLFPDSDDLPLHHWRQLELAGTTVYLHRTDPIAGHGFLIMGQTADKSLIFEQLIEPGIVPVGEDAFEYLRIEAGLPRFGLELTQEYIPLETGLWNDVSFNKGCYTGQEIIARMESRGRLAKRMVRLRPAKSIERGAPITSEGRTVGTITSAADGPAGPLALGYVKSATLEQGSPLLAGDVPLSV